MRKLLGNVAGVGGLGGVSYREVDFEGDEGLVVAGGGEQVTVGVDDPASAAPVDALTVPCAIGREAIGASHFSEGAAAGNPFVDGLMLGGARVGEYVDALARVAAGVVSKP